MVESSDAVKANKTKKCPTFPTDRCSPSNCIVLFSFELIALGYEPGLNFQVLSYK